jgi:hypothetical protein
MKKILLGLFILSGLAASAQSISGKVTDSDGEGLVGATVMLLNAKDSVLSSFAVTNAVGDFTIKKAFNGDFILRVQYVGFETHNQRITVKGEDIKLPTIKLEVSLLKEVVVEGERIPIVMKKDSIEYDAEAFKTQPNASVEDLLKKLPGVEVERDGSIKAQGRDVTRVLVDGKEFFGTDPQMATKNLPADAVSKIQVFDRKSEFSEFSGINDGNESRTINLVLKDGKKSGTFGRVGGGYGTQDRYQLNANINQFRQDNQFSLIARHNNINEQGFSISEYISFMGGGQNAFAGGGAGGLAGTGLNIGNDISNGFVVTSSTGLNYNRTFSAKSDIQSNYLYARINNFQETTTESTNFLNDNVFTSNQTSKSRSIANTHRLNLNYKYKFNALSDIQVRNTVSFNLGEIDGTSNTVTEAGLGTTTADNVSTSDRMGMNLNSRLIYRRKFGKPGRTLVTEGRVVASMNDTENRIRNEVDAGVGDINQEQLNYNSSRTLGLEMAYTEPIGSNKYLELRYVRENIADKDEKEFYDLTNGRELDENLTRYYDRDVVTHRVGSSFNYVKDKFRFTIGSNYENSRLLGELRDQDENFTNRYSRGLPFLRTNYDFKTSMSLGFDYSTRMLIPTVRQLQPVLDNSNPLNLYQGNPNLDPQYIHTARINFRFFDQFTSKSFFTFFQVMVTEDNIVTKRDFDPNTRVTMSSPVNTDNTVTITNFASFSGRIRFAKMRYSLSNRLTGNNGYNIVDNQTNDTRTLNNTVQLSIENAKKETIDWMVGTRIGTGKTVVENNEAANQKFTNNTYFSDMTIYFLKKWSVTSNFDWTLYNNASFSGSNDVALWRASVQRNFMQNDRGQLKFSVFDLLNQNLGINRTADFNFIQEQRIESLGRYFMLSFSYKLSNYESGGGMDRFMRRRI